MKFKTYECQFENFTAGYSLFDFVALPKYPSFMKNDVKSGNAICVFLDTEWLSSGAHQSFEAGYPDDYNSKQIRCQQNYLNSDVFELPQIGITDSGKPDFAQGRNRSIAAYDLKMKTIPALIPTRELEQFIHHKVISSDNSYMNFSFKEIRKLYPSLRVIVMVNSAKTEI